MKRALVVGLVIAFASLQDAEALADPTSDQKAAAQVLFEQARTLVEQGQFAEACPKLAESQKLDPGLGTMLWLADCYENNGQTASAWATFKEAAAAAADTHDKRERVARDRARSLEPRLPRLMILVPAEAASQGLVVARDGIELGPTQWGLPVPVDPGVHTVAARAAERKPWSTTVQLPAQAGTIQVTVPSLDAAAAPAPAAPPPAAPATIAPQSSTPLASSGETQSPKPGGTQRTIGLVVAGLGMLGLGLGTYFGLHAKSTYDGADCMPDDQCSAAGKQQRSDAFTQATIATVAMTTGAVALAGAAVLYFTAPRGEPVTVGLAPDGRGGALHVSMEW